MFKPTNFKNNRSLADFAFKNLKNVREGAKASKTFDSLLDLIDIAYHALGASSQSALPSNALPDLNRFMQEQEKIPFRTVLFDFIDKSNRSDVEIYKAAQLNKSLFNKIRTNPDYHVGKNIVLALCLALQLSKGEANRLLHAAGYAFASNSPTDTVISFCLKNQIYDLLDVNELLVTKGLPPLRSVRGDKIN